MNAMAAANVSASGRSFGPEGCLASRQPQRTQRALAPGGSGGNVCSRSQSGHATACDSNRAFNAELRSRVHCGKDGISGTRHPGPAAAPTRAYMESSGTSKARRIGREMPAIAVDTATHRSAHCGPCPRHACHDPRHSPGYPFELRASPRGSRAPLRRIRPHSRLGAAAREVTESSCT